MMKITLLLLIVCLTEIYANDRQILRECFREYGEDYDEGLKMTEEEMIRRVTPYKLGCITVCYMKTQLVDPIPIGKHITDSLNESYSGFTDTEIATYRNEVNRCIEEAKTDNCKLIECLKPWSSKIRIGKMIMYGSRSYRPTQNSTLINKDLGIPGQPITTSPANSP